MKRYPTYKDSGVKWIGEIPSHWKTRKIKYIFTEKSEKGYPDEPVLCSTQKYGVIPQSMYENRVVVVNKGLEGLKLVRKGEFVISLRSFQGGIEYAHYQGIISAAYTILKLNEGIDAEYMKYLLKSFEFIQLLQTCVTGIREGQNINYALLRKNYIALPPFPEQRAIVSFLDSELGKIDTYVEKEKQLIERLKELKQSVIARAVTRGINPDAKMKPSGISWIVDIPQHWKVKRLSSFFTENSDINTNLKYTEAYKFNYGSLIRKDEGIDIKDLEDTYKKYTILKDNDIVINGLNLNYDFVSQRVAQAYNKGIITSAYLVLTPRKGVNYSYYCYLFKAMDNMKLFHGMGTGIRLTLSFRDLKPQSLPVPPTAEQQKIVDYITAATTKIDRLIVEKTYEIEHIKELRQRLIADAVTGKIDVREPLNKKGAAAATDRE